MFCFLVAVTKKSQVQAFVPDNVNVTIPTTINATFEEDGHNSIEKYIVKNHLEAPIWISNIRIASYNGWELVSDSTNMETDTKHIVFKLGEQVLAVGNNQVNIQVGENSSKELSFEIMRGAWTHGVETEKAFTFEIEYEIGKKAFQLHFDGKGSSSTPETITACNGETVTLPKVTRPKYNFSGWKDENGKLYLETFTMPIGNVTLTAVWKPTEAYAIFSADDGTLSFVRLEAAVPVGSKYNGKTVTEIYGGIENASYEPFKAPWSPRWQEVKSIVALDAIYPTSTAYWFIGMEKAEYVELSKFDMSGVKDMTSMFSDTGRAVTGSFRMEGIAGWDVSNVEQMGTVFRGVGRSTTQFYLEDISGWDTSGAKDMWLMFASTGIMANWSMDLSKWDVSNVTRYEDFDYNIQGKLVLPKWSN